MTKLANLRIAMGLNQVEFGALIGRSYQSVQGYEGGKVVPREIMKKIVSVATERGFADIAFELTGKEYEAKRVLKPGEIPISSRRQRRNSPMPSSAPSPDRQASTDHGRLHALLDQILASNDAAAIPAISRIIEVVAESVGGRQAATGAKKKPAG